VARTEKSIFWRKYFGGGAGNGGCGISIVGADTEGVETVSGWVGLWSLKQAREQLELGQ
jgi:hypothetical protein